MKKYGFALFFVVLFRMRINQSTKSLKFQVTVNSDQLLATFCIFFLVWKYNFHEELSKKALHLWVWNDGDFLHQISHTKSQHFFTSYNKNWWQREKEIKRIRVGSNEFFLDEIWNEMVSQ